ncbi:hypothetical protein BOX15_Mlig019418g1, partial [Macrostomum lignano]
NMNEQQLLGDKTRLLIAAAAAAAAANSDSAKPAMSPASQLMQQQHPHPQAHSPALSVGSGGVVGSSALASLEAWQSREQQYSSLLLNQAKHGVQQQQLHHQQHLTLPHSVKSEASSNNSSDREADFCPAGGGSGSMDFAHSGGVGSSGDGLGTVVRTRRRKAGLPDDQRVCAVCAEPASGYNFDRLTCESCKAFFRRNALKSREKIKPCSRGGGCDVSGSQRKHCPTCRLEKCLLVGMKKELILPPEKLEQRAKPKRRLKNGSCDGDAVGGAGEPPLHVAGQRHTPGQRRSIQRQRQLPQHPQHQFVQQQLQHQHQAPAAINGASSASVDLDPSPSSAASAPTEQLTLSELAATWAVVSGAGRRWETQLSGADRDCLANLEEAVSRVREALAAEDCGLLTGADGGSGVGGIGRLEQAFNQMDACIRRIISVVKLIPSFSEVEKDSQILMLKVNIYGLVILYWSFFCKPAASSGVSLMQELAAAVSAIICSRPEASDLTPADLEQYQANAENVFDQLDQLSGQDDLVKMLMLALKLFNSDTMPAEVRGPIEAAQSSYSRLLKKYLACKFGVPEAMRAYPKLLLTFVDMRTVESKMTDFTKLLSVESLNPLVREVTQAS